MDIDGLDPIKSIFALFLAGVLAAFFLYLYNTQIAPTFAGALKTGSAS